MTIFKWLLTQTKARYSNVQNNVQFQYTQKWHIHKGEMSSKLCKQSLNQVHNLLACQVDDCTSAATHNAELKLLVPLPD